MFRRLAFFAVLSLSLVTSTGCGILAPIGSVFGIKQTDTDEVKVARLENGYNTIMGPLVFAMSSGFIPSTTGDQIELYRSAADKALDQLKLDVAAKKPIDDSEALRAFNAAVDQLTIYKTRYGNGSSDNRPPATGGSSVNPAVNQPGAAGTSDPNPLRTPAD